MAELISTSLVVDILIHLIVVHKFIIAHPSPSETNVHMGSFERNCAQTYVQREVGVVNVLFQVGVLSERIADSECVYGRKRATCNVAFSFLLLPIILLPVLPGITVSPSTAILFPRVENVRKRSKIQIAPASKERGQAHISHHLSRGEGGGESAAVNHVPDETHREHERSVRSRRNVNKHERSVRSRMNVVEHECSVRLLSRTR